MQKEFNSSLKNDGIHILDPFTGTGTFISRLVQSGIIPKEELIKKFKSEIHANEIVLLLTTLLVLMLNLYSTKL